MNNNIIIKILLYIFYIITFTTILFYNKEDVYKGCFIRNNNMFLNLNKKNIDILEDINIILNDQKKILKVLIKKSILCESEINDINYKLKNIINYKKKFN